MKYSGFREDALAREAGEGKGGGGGVAAPEDAMFLVVVVVRGGSRGSERLGEGRGVRRHAGIVGGGEAYFDGKRERERWC